MTTNKSSKENLQPPMLKLVRAYNYTKVEKFKKRLDDELSVWPKKLCVYERKILGFGYEEYTFMSQEEEGAPYIQTDVSTNPYTDTVVRTTEHKV